MFQKLVFFLVFLEIVYASLFQHPYGFLKPGQLGQNHENGDPSQILSDRAQGRLTSSSQMVNAFHLVLDTTTSEGRDDPISVDPLRYRKEDHEALSSLHLAKEMMAVGKMNKAMKLFEHALAIEPTNPDILTEYGLFLEEINDVLRAEHLYKRALLANPAHLGALVCRQRTLPLVEEIDHTRRARIDSKRDRLMRIPEASPALRRAKRESYYLHIYHTNAIEGNTMSLMQTRSILETNYAVPGKSIAEHNEVLGLDAALKFVNSSLLHRIGDINVADILAIHRRVMGHVEPLAAGRFREHQVFVGSHVPPPPCDIDARMSEFVDWLSSDAALVLHPIEYAALAHYRLVAIHPFTDGNGRTSRLLMNLVLMQAGFPPVTVKVSDRLEYYEFLELANHGDIRPFVRFIARCTEKTLDEYLIASEEGLEKAFPELTSGLEDHVIHIESWTERVNSFTDSPPHPL